MSLATLFRTRTAAPRPRRRPASLKPTLDGLEARLVLSHAHAAVAPAGGMVEVQALRAKASQQLTVPIRVTNIDVTGLVRDAATGVINLTGTITGTVLGQTFSSPLTGTITPGKNAKSCPVLDLNIQPIHLSVLGLNVDTSAICLNLKAQKGGGLLGDLLCGGLNDVVTSATNGATDQALSQVNGLTDNGRLLATVNRAFSQAKTRLAGFTPGTSTDCPVLNLALGPVKLNLLGLNLRLDNCANGPVTVNVSATKGGGLLGDLLCGLTGSGTGKALTRQINGVLGQISRTVG